jgi:voltage-gated potassium channel
VSAEPSEAFPRERCIRRRAERAVARRHVLTFLIVASAVLAVVTGVVARLIDRRDFHSFGDGIWWAIVTLGTVGYGDIVPHTTWGRVLGSIVIVCGVTFIAFLTATVTSLFVTVDQKDALAKVHALREESEEDTRAALRAIDERLAAIDAKLDRVVTGGSGSVACRSCS